MTPDPAERAHVERVITQMVIRDARVIGAALVGSIANGTGDQYSDLDYYLYVTGRWWKRDELADWLIPIGLPVNLHYWTGVEKHHLLIGTTRVDFSIGSEQQQDEIAAWPRLFFPASSILKDVNRRLSRAYDANQQLNRVDSDNDEAAYLLNLINIAIQLCRGEVVNARSRWMSVLEAKARIMQTLPLGSELWREPTRHVERNLTPNELADLSDLAFISAPDELRHRVAGALESASSDTRLNDNVRSSCAFYAAELRS